jgi:hypothetical protein
LRVVLARVDYDGGRDGEGKLAITLHPHGSDHLAKELTGQLS